MKRFLLLLALIVAAGGLASAQQGDQKGSLVPGGGPGGQAADTSWIRTKYLDVAYAAKSPAQKLDLYLPNEGKGPFPLIIEIHGGGFFIGEKSGQIAPMLEGLERGYALASLSYRLSGEARFPAAVNDVKAAIKFLRANAARYNLDPARFATWGGSAGGNLSAMAATSGDVASLVDAALGNAAVSDAVQAAVDWFGPISFSTMDAEFKALGTSGAMGATNSSGSAESKYLGKTIGTAEAQPLVEAASPQTYISKKSPPMYIQHGTADRNIPITQSINFSKNLAAAIGAGKVVFEKIEGAGHGGEQFETAANVKKILDFLDKYLK
jgi:acetyl esterase/lipase